MLTGALRKFRRESRESPSLLEMMIGTAQLNKLNKDFSALISYMILFLFVSLFSKIAICI
ncbi:hypothetical protein NEOC84_000647|nr:hypothetical protein [Neochlamydia sp. AcF84]